MHHHDVHTNSPQRIKNVIVYPNTTYSIQLHPLHIVAIFIDFLNFRCRYSEVHMVQNVVL